MSDGGLLSEEAKLPDSLRKAPLRSVKELVAAYYHRDNARVDIQEKRLVWKCEVVSHLAILGQLYTMIQRLVQKLSISVHPYYYRLAPLSLKVGC
jgi:hypothetical protein